MGVDGNIDGGRLAIHHCHQKWSFGCVLSGACMGGGVITSVVFKDLSFQCYFCFYSWRWCGRRCQCVTTVIENLFAGGADPVLVAVSHCGNDDVDVEPLLLLLLMLLLMPL